MVVGDFEKVYKAKYQMWYTKKKKGYSKEKKNLLKLLKKKKKKRKKICEKINISKI